MGPPKPVSTCVLYNRNEGGCSVVIVDELGIDLLIGTDLLKSGGSQVNYYRDSVILGNRSPLNGDYSL